MSIMCAGVSDHLTIKINQTSTLSEAVNKSVWIIREPLPNSNFVVNIQQYKTDRGIGAHICQHDILINNATKLTLVRVQWKIESSIICKKKIRY